MDMWVPSSSLKTLSPLSPEVDETRVEDDTSGFGVVGSVKKTQTKKYGRQYFVGQGIF